jgi:hypothetical protein
VGLSQGHHDSLRLPQLDRVALRVMGAGETSIRIRFRINDNIDVRTSKLFDHGIEIANTKIDHPSLLAPAEILRVVWERCKGGWTRFLGPRLLAVVRGHEINSEMIFVPMAQRRGIFRAEEKPSDASNFFRFHARRDANQLNSSLLDSNGFGRSGIKTHEFPGVVERKMRELGIEHRLVSAA